MQSNYSLHCDNCFQQTKYASSTFSTKVEEVERSIIVVHDFSQQFSNCYKFHFIKIEYNMTSRYDSRVERWLDTSYKKKKLMSDNF